MRSGGRKVRHNLLMTEATTDYHQLIHSSRMLNGVRVHLRRSRTVVPPMQHNGKYAKPSKGHRVRLFPSPFVHSGQRHESFSVGGGGQGREEDGKRRRVRGPERRGIYVRFSSVYALRQRGRESEGEALLSAHGMNVQWHVSNTQHACSWREVVASSKRKSSLSIFLAPEPERNPDRVRR